MAEVTLENFLKNDASVKQAKVNLAEATKALSGARNAAPDVIAQLKENQTTADNAYRKAVSDATNYFKNNFIGISTAGISDSIAALEVAKKTARDAETIASFQTSIDSLKQKLSNPKSYEQYATELKKVEETKKEKSKKTKETPSEQPKSNVSTESFTKNVEVAGQYIAELSAAGRKELAVNLNNAYGLNLRTDGVYDPELKKAYVKALSDNFTRSLDFNRDIPFTEFLVTAQKEGTYKAAGGEPSLSGTISNPTKAASLINSAFKTELGRDATVDEIAKYKVILNAAEKKNPFKTVKGITTGGLDREQFLKEEISKLPEFAQKKTDKTALTSQSITNMARLNGFNLTPEQISDFTKRVESGTDIKVINNEIRSIAALGQSDKVQNLLKQGIDLETIYSPYKNVMASVLEINPTAISLFDNTLRSAMGPDKEMTIYDFQRALRKDPRWQYTNNAREEVASVTQKILQDFGFMG